MNKRTESILYCLLGVAKKHKKFYCYVSQERLLELLSKYHKFEISNRTLNRDLLFLEENGFINRVRRIRVDNSGKFVFTSTLYKFTAKLFNWLNSLGNHIKNLFSFFRLPKVADHLLKQKQASPPVASASVKFMLITEKDGSVLRYYPQSGLIEPV